MITSSLSKKATHILMLLTWLAAMALPLSAQDTGSLAVQIEALYYAQRYAEAARLAQIRLGQLEDTWGKQHPHVADGLSNLADLLELQGLYEEAEPHDLRALQIREQAHGEWHPDVASSLNSLGMLYARLGLYDKAEPHYLRALQVFEAVFDPDHLTVGKTLANLGALYRLQGRYDEAEPRYLRALQIIVDHFGPDDPSIATVENNLGVLYVSMGRFRDAEPLYLHALRVEVAELGPQHANLAPNLNNLGALYRLQGRYDEAERLYQWAYHNQVNTVGPEHPAVVQTLNNWATLYNTQGQHRKAEELYRQAMMIALDRYEVTHPLVATALYGLAGAYTDQGRYKEAASLLEEALRIQGESLEPDHPSIAKSLEGLAELDYRLARYEQAESRFEQARQLREAAFGPDDFNLTTSLTGLGVLYTESGRYSEAELLYRRVLQIEVRALNPDHPHVAGTLNNLGSLYADLGRYDEAISLHTRALAIQRAAYGERHPDIARTLGYLGVAHIHLEQYEEALPLHTRSLEIREAMLGAEHAEVATSLNNLAVLYELLGRFDEVEPLYQRALQIQSTTIGERHPEFAINLNNLAWLYVLQRRYDEAEPLYTRVLKILEDALGSHHLKVSDVLNNLANLAMARHRTQVARQHLQRAAQIQTTFIRDVLTFATENEKQIFLRTGADDFNALMTLMATAPGDTVTTQAAFDLVLQRKALQFDVAVQQNAFYRSANNPVGARLYETLQLLSRQLANLTYRVPSDSAFTDYQQQHARVSQRREQVEDSLAKQSGLHVRDRQKRRADVRHVSAALQQGDVLVEYVRYQEVDFEATGSDSPWTIARYAAFSLTGAGDLRFVDLGPASRVDSLIQAYRREIDRFDLQLGEIQQRRSERRLGATAQALYRVLLAPLDLPAQGTIFTVPDGLLHLLPFAILQDDRGTYLIDRHGFTYLSSGRDLTGFEETQKLDTLYLFAGVAFDAEPTVSDRPLPSGATTSARSRDFRARSFQPLPGTVLEADSILAVHGAAKSKVFLGSEANEETLLNLVAPWRLHIATHGFFLADVEDLGIIDRRATSLSVSASPSWILAKWENPLLRSGLALAGANQTGQVGEGSQGYDGITTALELAGMNLQGTDMVVLSACETGLGRVQNGEGVFGLRRSFQLAGAQTLVMSLWKVADEETKDFMINFYRRLKVGEGKAAALRSAALAIKGQPGLSHPYYWGAFILAGNPE